MAVIAPGDIPRKFVKAEYVVETIDATIEGLNSSFHMEKRPLSKGFEFRWLGGKLATLLNQDKLLTELILKHLEDSPKTRITISRERRLVRIALEPGVPVKRKQNEGTNQSVGLFPSKTCIQIADLIAKHVRSVSS